MTDPQLFGPTFGGDSFAAWRALLGAFYGLPLDDDQLETFQTLTGREKAPVGAFDELWLAIGRRGGKSHAAALVATFEAAFKDHRAKLAPGEVATVMLLAADRAQARTLLRYVRGLFEHPMLKPLVARETAAGLELVNRSAIEVHTASHRAVRGYTLAAVVCDEIAFWHSDGARPDAEVIAALRPALVTLGGKLVAISSPYSKRGELWNSYRRHFGQDDSTRVLVAQAPSPAMNPTIPQHVIDDAMKDDAARASAEWLAQFRADIEQFLSVEVVTEAMRTEPLSLPPRSGLRYFAFVDPSGGGADEFTLAIGHAEDAGLIVVDQVVGRRGNPAAITGEFCDLLKEYRIGTVRGDRYAAEWSRTEFRRNGIAYLDAPGVRSELYLSMASALQAGRVELPPCEKLERQLVSLERRTTRGGRDIIDHPPGLHDDRGNAAAGLVATLAAQRRAPKILIGTYEHR
ncbi:hypothetical protein [Antarcticimicrobium luteum]|nr:hypothetical protein [Antarcticimicrobium luteum]